MVKTLVSVALLISSMNYTDVVDDGDYDIVVRDNVQVVRHIDKHADCYNYGYEYGYDVTFNGDVDEDSYYKCTCKKFKRGYGEGVALANGENEAIEHGHPLVVYANGDCKDELPVVEVHEDTVIELFEEVEDEQGDI